MRRQLLPTLAALSLFWAAPARAQQIKEPAEVMPADTLAYAELRQPGLLVKQIAGLFEGSALANVPDSLTKLRDLEWPLGRSMGEAAIFSLLLSPEVIGEAQRLRGAAVALTGFKKGQPEYLAVVLPGESHGPPLLMRALLVQGRVRPAGEAEGVKLYQWVSWPTAIKTAPANVPGQPVPGPEGRRGPGGRPDDGVLAERPVRGKDGVVAEKGPAFAMMPGALLAGSPDAVKDAVRRIKGKAGEKTLAGVKTYQEASKEVGKEAGLFAYYDVGRTKAALEEGLAGPGAPRKVAALLKETWSLVNVKAFRAGVYALTLDEGTLRYRQLALLDPREKSPMLELFPSKGVDRGLFHFTPNDAVFAAALSNDDGEKRWARALKMADAISRLGGGRDVPSERLPGLEKELGFELGKDVFGKITGIGVALGDPLKAPLKKLEEKRPGFHSVSVYPEVPFVVSLRADSEEAARDLAEKVLPRVFGLFAGKKEVEPTSRQVRGQKIYTLGPEQRGPMGAFRYGRQGSTLVIGGHAEPVAQALDNGGRQKGWLADPKVREQLGKNEEAIVLGVARPFSFLTGFLLVSWSGSEMREEGGPQGVAPRPRPAPQNDARPRQEKPRPPAAGRPARPPEPVPVSRSPEQERLSKQLDKVLGRQDLMVLSITRRPDRFTQEITWTGLKSTVARLTDFLLEESLKDRRGRTSRQGPHGQEERPTEAVPVQPPPKR